MGREQSSTPSVASDSQSGPGSRRSAGQPRKRDMVQLSDGQRGASPGARHPVWAAHNMGYRHMNIGTWIAFSRLPLALTKRQSGICLLLMNKVRNINHHSRPRTEESRGRGGEWNPASCLIRLQESPGWFKGLPSLAILQRSVLHVQNSMAAGPKPAFLSNQVPAWPFGLQPLTPWAKQPRLSFFPINAPSLAAKKVVKSPTSTPDLLLPDWSPAAGNQSCDPTMKALTRM